MKLGLVLVFALSALSVSFAQDDLKLWKPYKDKQFTPKLLATGKNCNVSLYDYNEIDHVNGQSCATDSGMSSSLAQPSRITAIGKDKRREVTYNINGVDVRSWEVGKKPSKSGNGPKCAVIWCHGAVQSTHPHHLGARDTNFGGNQNRLMNLAMQQDCTYYSPDFRGASGYNAIQHLIDHLKDNGVEEIFISGSSAGAAALNIAARNPRNTDVLAGLVYLGTYTSPYSLKNTPAFKKGVPIIFSQGANDKYTTTRDGFFKLQDEFPQATNPNNNTMLQVFEDGGHGTPIRMIDWRSTLNWARVQNRKRSSLIQSKEVVCYQDGSSSPGVNGFLNVLDNVGHSLSADISNKSVNCKEFRQGGKHGYPITSELKRTKGCKPFIVNDTTGEIVATVNKINCVGGKSENRPGSYSYKRKGIPTRQPADGESIMERPGCHRQAK